MNEAAQRRDVRCRIAGGADDENGIEGAEARWRNLPERRKNLWLQRRVDAVLPHVVHNADHLPLGAVIGETQSSRARPALRDVDAEGMLAKILARERAIDHDRGRGKALEQNTLGFFADVK